MADARQMHPDLVGAAGSDLYFQKRKSLKASQHAISGQRLTALGQARGHPNAAHRIAGDRRGRSGPDRS